MAKRVMIFSPEITSLEGIAQITDSFFKEKFPEYPVSIEKYASIADSSKDGKHSIGDKNEVLVILDRRLCPHESIGTNPYGGNNLCSLDWIESALKVIRNYCGRNPIPHLKYEGEVEKKQSDLLKQKIEEVRGKIILKLIEH